MSRRLRLTLLAAGLLIAAGGAAWLALPQAAEALIASRLAARGLGPVSATVTRVDLAGAHLARLDAGDGALVLRDVDLTWSLGGGLEALTVAEATLTGRWTAEDGLDLGPLAPLLAPTDTEAEPDAPFDLPVERVKIDKATAVIALPQGDLVATASGSIKRAEPGPAVTLSADVTAPGLSGTVTFAGTAAGVGAIPATGDGWLRLTAEGFAAPGIAGAVTGSLAAAVRVGADAVALAADAPVQVTLADLAPDLQALAAPYLAEAPAMLAVTVAGAEPGKPPSLNVSGLSDAGGLVLSSDRLTLLAEAGDATVRLTTGGSLRLRDPLPAAALRDASAEVLGVVVDGMPVSATVEDASLTLTAEGLTAEGSVEARAEQVDLGGGSAEAAAFTGRLRLSAQPDLTGALFADGGSVTLTGLRLMEDIAATEPVTLSLSAPEGPLVRLYHGEDAGLIAAVNAGFVAPSVSLSTPGGPARIAFADLSLTAAAGRLGQPVVAVTGSGGTASLAGTELHDVALKAGLAEGTPTLDLTARLDALPGEPADLATSALHPYSLSLNAAPGEAGLALNAELRTAKKALLASAQGTLDLADGSGRARVSVPRQVFSSGGLQPDDIHALLGTFVHDVSGAIAVDGTVRWDARGLRPNLKVLVQDVGLTQGFVTLNRINGVITLTGISPLRTPPGQQVSVAAVDAGLPLVDAVASFEIADDTLLLDAASATLAEGTIRARPSAIPLSLDQGELTLDVHDMRLAPLVDLAEIEGLRARGRLAGTVPLRFAGGDVIIDNATLSSMMPERVAYDPAEVPGALSGGGQSVDLVLQAMEDFHYEQLSLTIDGRASGQMTVKLHIAGANPAFYDGYPVEFNLSVSGELAKAVQAGLSGYRVPDMIRDRMEEFAVRP